MPKTRRELTLKEKYDVLKYYESGHSERDTAEKFNISKGKKCFFKIVENLTKHPTGAVSNIKKRKLEIIAYYEKHGAKSTRKRARRHTSNTKLNDMVWIWFQKVRATDIPISGPLIQAAAKDIAAKLDKLNFKHPTAGSTLGKVLTMLSSEY